MSYWRLFSSSGLRICTSPGWGTLVFFWRSPKALHLLRLSEGGGEAILPRLTATDGITSKQWLCAVAVPLSTTTDPKQHRIRTRPSLTSSPSISAPASSSPSPSILQRSSVAAPPPVPARFCALRYRQSQYPSGPATGWSDRVTATSRELLLATGIFESSPQHSARHISGCSEALAACYGRQFRITLCNICPAQPFEVAEVATVVCVADHKEAEAWCLPLSYSSSCHYFTLSYRAPASRA